MEADQKFIEDIARVLVNHPEDVRTERTIDERGVLIMLYVNPSDMGYVIGKKGRIAIAIRTLLGVMGAKTNSRLNFKIHEPEGSPFAKRQTDLSNVDTSAVEDIKL